MYNKKVVGQVEFTVIVDDREDVHYLKHLQRTFPTIFFDYRRIEEGDYVSEHVMVERKTISDLWSSIHDGRFHSQVNRMMTHNPEKVIVYLVTGSVEAEKVKMDSLRERGIVTSKFDPDLLDSCIASLVVRENIRVICDTNELLGLNRIIKIMRKIEVENVLDMPSQRDPDMLAARLLNISKKDWFSIKKKFGTSFAYLSTLSVKDFMTLPGFGKIKSEKVHLILQNGW
ncbi:MAG: ERCC4 domain-containing protein [Dehalococcoidales bacterium]